MYISVSIMYKNSKHKNSLSPD